MGQPCQEAITITTVYDQATPRRVVAVRYRCAACGQEWDHLPLSAALRAKTSAPFDTQCDKHWDACTQEAP